MSAEARLQAASNEYQKLQDDLSTAVESRQRLDAQLNENEAEFATLKPHNTVYKLIGPVLVKQDQEEAKSNVKKRLEYIRGEITRVESHITDLSNKSEKAKNEIVTIQAALQAKAQQSGEGAVAS
ncbi:Prefoldin subunit [Ceratobasidium sp. AG-Ba]|nr:Prefoldin subunit [Ceratobasidium sp. AG-Ba]QRW09441.1 Prefoldin subunit [Ceratobasidium sp. AG-Ba]